MRDAHPWRSAEREQMGSPHERRTSPITAVQTLRRGRAAICGTAAPLPHIGWGRARSMSLSALTPAFAGVDARVPPLTGGCKIRGAVDRPGPHGGVDEAKAAKSPSSDKK
jgi:hypothetical protein